MNLKTVSKQVVIEAPWRDFRIGKSLGMSLEKLQHLKSG